MLRVEAQRDKERQPSRRRVWLACLLVSLATVPFIWSVFQPLSIRLGNSEIAFGARYISPPGPWSIAVVLQEQHGGRLASVRVKDFVYGVWW
jgi:hypothetical protein